MSSPSIEERLRRLEDLAEINALLARYSLIIDQGWNGEVVDIEEFHRIFAKDAIWRSAAMQIEAVGLEAIMDGTRHATSDVQFAMHAFINPLIEIDGDSAHCRCLMWVAARRDGLTRQVYMSQTADLSRVADGWRISEVDVHFGMGVGPEFQAESGTQK